MQLRLRQFFLVTGFLIACGNQPQVTSQDPNAETDASEDAVTGKTFFRATRPVAGQYIVVLNKDKNLLARGDERSTDALARSLASNVGRVYAHALHGFSTQMTEAQAKALARDPRVSFVQESGIHSVLGFDGDDFDGESPEAIEALATQSGATWGLDRIDQADRPLNKSYTSQNDGHGVSAYIVDTGIHISHQDYQGRAVAGFSAINDGKGSDDCHGHGSHVAGTVGGKTWGVAKGVALYAVRVLSCKGEGTDEEVIAGIDWVVQNAKLPAVANMSLGGDASPALDAAIVAAVKAGITFAVAAGNDSKDACKYSPARVPEAITAGSSTSSDRRSSFSNTGTCLDIFAPGSSITSVNGKSETGSASMSGTSMASPHVAGAAALVLSANPSFSPQEVRDALVSHGAKDKIGGWFGGGVGTGSPNILLNVQWIGVSAP